MLEKNGNEELLSDLERLKKDVYFSYVLKLNHRYVYKDLYSIFERINYISINIEQYMEDIRRLYKKIDVKTVEFTLEELEELNQVRRTKEISIKQLENYIKSNKRFMKAKDLKAEKNLLYLRYAGIGLTVLFVFLKGGFA